MHEGCPVDHGAARWARTIHAQTGVLVHIEVREDTGAKENWISPTIVKELALDPIATTDADIVYDFNGTPYSPTGEVKISLGGKRPRSLETRCLIAPERFPMNGITFGRQFLQQVGHVHDVFHEKEGESTNLILIGPKQTVRKEAYRRK